MANVAQIAINIATEFTGKAAFKTADTAAAKLNKTVKGLAKTYVGLYGAQKAYQFGKSSVQAFVADNQAAVQLSNTLNNLGLAFETTRVESYIKQMEALYHVADDKLRPAFQSLVQATGSISKAQELMGTALNASKSKNIDLQTVVYDLNQAYVGNLKGIKKYELGLTNAELATMSFEQVIAKFNKTFAGAAMKYANSPAGQMDALTISSNNAKETIGGALVNAFDRVTKAGGGVQQITGFIDRLSQSVADQITLVGKLGAAWNKNNIFKAMGMTNKTILDLFRDPTGLQMPKGQYTKGGGKALDLNAAKRKAVEDAAIKRAKELAALAKAQANAAALAAKAKKEALIIDQANKIFNMDLIQNTAALQGKISEDEQKRLLAQQAILTGNADAAAKLTQELLATQNAALQARMLDPFIGWTSGAAAALAEIVKLQKALKDVSGQPIQVAAVPVPTTNASTAVAGNPQGIYNYGAGVNSSFTYGQGNPNRVDVNISLDKGLIVDTTNNATANGDVVSINRTQYNFNS